MSAMEGQGADVVSLTDEEFDSAIADALDIIEAEYGCDFENIVIMAADEPDEDQLSASDDGTCSEDGDLLGLYDGVSLYDRGADYGMACDIPDVVTIFKGPHERLGGTKEQVLEEVRKTVIHELGHYFGLDEDQLDKMGLGDPEI